MMGMLFEDDNYFKKKILDLKPSEITRLAKELGCDPDFTSLMSTDIKKLKEAYNEIFLGDEVSPRVHEIDIAVDKFEITYDPPLVEEATKDSNDGIENKPNLSEEQYKKELENLLKRVEKLEESSIQDIQLNNISLPELEESVEVEGTFPREWPLILKLAHARVNLMLVGPTGCGKTYLSAKLAEALKLPYSSVSCTSGMDESEFKGWLLPTGDTMKFNYIPSGFITMYENGGVFCADEMDAGDPNVMSFINKALANDSFFLPQRYEKPIVKKHKDFVWVACTNTLGVGADENYTARNQLDLATLDRHRVGTIQLDYSEKVEMSLVSPVVYTWGSAIRKAMKDLVITDKPLSTRTLIEIEKLRKMYDMDATEWNERFFASWDEQRKLEVYEKVNAILREMNQ